MNRHNAPPLDDPRLWTVEPGYALGLLRLGTPRQEVLQTLKENRFETEEDHVNREHYINEMDATLYFDDQYPYPLELIEVEDDRARFGTLKVLGDFPHNFFSTIPSSDTLWFDDLSQITNDFPSPDPKPTPTDQQLLDSGTLWMTSLGIGFALTGGKITTLYLCNPDKLPSSGYGDFTGAQRHLSERLQLASFKAPKSKTHPALITVRISLLLAALLVAAYFGKQAWDEQVRWNNAPEVDAEVIAVWPAPPEPFPSKYQLAFQDSSGNNHEVELEQNDVYGIPEVGKTVPLRYLPEAPDKVLGPAKIHDVGFIRFAPYLLGTAAIYFALQFFSDVVVGRLLRNLS